MIEVRLINGSQIVLNSEMIEFVEATPDTVISLSNGKKILVLESVTEVVDRVLDFRGRVGAKASRKPTSRRNLEASLTKES